MAGKGGKTKRKAEVGREAEVGIDLVTEDEGNNEREREVNVFFSGM
jgi:hypothetical protein